MECIVKNSTHTLYFHKTFMSLAQQIFDHLDFDALLSLTTSQSVQPTNFANFLSHVCFTVSGIGRERSELREKAAKFGAQYSHEYNSSVTHVVVNDTNPLLTSDKVLRAHADGKFVVQRSWLDESIEEGTCLSEARYRAISKKRRVEYKYAADVRDVFYSCVTSRMHLDPSLFTVNLHSVFVPDNVTNSLPNPKNLPHEMMIELAKDISTLFRNIQLALDTDLQLEKERLSFYKSKAASLGIDYLGVYAHEVPEQLSHFDVKDYVAMGDFSCLPQEILLEIISFLPTAVDLLHSRAICKQFNNIIVQNMFLWKGILYRALIDSELYPTIDASFTQSQLESRLSKDILDYNTTNLMKHYKETITNKYERLSKLPDAQNMYAVGIFLLFSEESQPHLPAVTKKGGEPNLPQGVTQQEAWGAFQAQICFSQFKHTMFGAQLFPEQGMLYLFTNDSDNVHALYVEDETNLQQFTDDSAVICTAFQESPYLYQPAYGIEDFEELVESNTDILGVPTRTENAILYKPIYTHQVRSQDDQIVLWQSIDEDEYTVYFSISRSDLQKKKFDNIRVSEEERYENSYE